MPSPVTADLPRPKDWDEFENIVADLMIEEWDDPNVVRNGRSGQSQDGVDIYGQPRHLERRYAAVQCKCTDTLKIKDVEAEVEKAKGFEPLLADYTVATTAPRDAKLQKDVRTRQWPFPVRVIFWEDICLRLGNHQRLLEKHFGGFMKVKTTQDEVLSSVMSLAKDDFAYDDRAGVYTCQRDVDLRLVVDREKKDWRDQREFDEPWVRRFIKWPGRTGRLHVEYRASRIMTLEYVSVDEHRYMIPLPRAADDLTISPLQHRIGLIINRWYPLQDGLLKAGITVREE